MTLSWQRLTPVGRFLFLATITPLIVANAWALHAIFHYFNSLVTIVIGASLSAFLLSYPVEWMVSRGARRSRARVLVFLLALVLVVALGALLMPMALLQAHQLFSHLHVWIESGQRQLGALNDQFRHSNLPLNLDVLELQIGERLKLELEKLAQPLLEAAVLTASHLLDGLLTVVMTFYFLQFGDRVWAGLIGWFPADLRQPLSRALRQSFHNFFLGQLILSACLSTALILVFTLLRVPYGYLFGLTIGTMALVPLGGTVGIALVTVLVTIADLALGLKVLIAAFIVQQLLENGIAPRLLGHVTGLNPVWVLISILTGARIGGLLGVLVAVPTAVIIKTYLSVQQARLYPPGDLPGDLPTPPDPLLPFR
jgi:predicted PurR-regulated permease PerM